MIHELFIIISLWIQPSWCPNICASMLNVSSHDLCHCDCSRPILLPVHARRLGLKDSSLSFPSSLTHTIIRSCSRHGCPTVCRRQCFFFLHEDISIVQGWRQDFSASLNHQRGLRSGVCAGLAKTLHHPDGNPKKFNFMRTAARRNSAAVGAA